LTALRTGAAGGVAAAALARPESAVLALFGAGAQAHTQLLAAAEVLPLREARVVGRTPANVAAFLVWASEQPSLRATLVRAAVAEDAVAGADVVVTATGSATPVFPGRLLAPGTHVTAIGSFTPAMRELDEDARRGARLVVDERRAARAEAGELVGLSGDDVVEIGEVLAGRAPGRRDGSDRTVFKSVGNAVQDLVVAARVYELAVRRGLGEEVRFP
ncbi:MAG: ornithine cyclodeaminase family protein, partial [Chloroflexota bacterium]